MVLRPLGHSQPLGLRSVLGHSIQRSLKPPALLSSVVRSPLFVPFASENWVARWSDDPLEEKFELAPSEKPHLPTSNDDSVALKPSDESSPHPDLPQFTSSDAIAREIGSTEAIQSEQFLALQDPEVTVESHHPISELPTLRTDRASEVQESSQVEFSSNLDPPFQEKTQTVSSAIDVQRSELIELSSIERSSQATESEPEVIQTDSPKSELIELSSIEHSSQAAESEPQAIQAESSSTPQRFAASDDSEFSIETTADPIQSRENENPVSERLESSNQPQNDTEYSSPVSSHRASIEDDLSILSPKTQASQTLSPTPIDSSEQSLDAISTPVELFNQSNLVETQPQSEPSFSPPSAEVSQTASTAQDATTTTTSQAIQPEAIQPELAAPAALQASTADQDLQSEEPQPSAQSLASNPANLQADLQADGISSLQFRLAPNSISRTAAQTPLEQTQETQSSSSVFFSELSSTSLEFHSGTDEQRGEEAFSGTSFTSHSLNDTQSVAPSQNSESSHLNPTISDSDQSSSLESPTESSIEPSAIQREILGDSTKVSDQIAATSPHFETLNSRSLATPSEEPIVSEEFPLQHNSLEAAEDQSPSTDSKMLDQRSLEATSQEPASIQPKSLENLLDIAQPPVEQEPFTLQPQLEAQPVSETLISPWAEPATPQVGEVLISPLASTEAATPSNSTAQIDDEQFEQLAQMVYRMMRSRYRINAERDLHMHTLHSSWLNIIHARSPTQPNQKSKQVETDLILDRQFSMLVQEVYQITHFRLRSEQERTISFR